MSDGGASAAVVTELTHSSRTELMARFVSLGGPSPTLPEGVHLGHLPVAVESTWRSWAASTGSRPWVGKSFTPGPPDSSGGRGYNLYAAADTDGTEHTGLPFMTSVVASLVDGRPSILLDYRTFPGWPGKQGLVDEVRPVVDGVLLGIYRTDRPVEGFTPRLAPDSRADWEFFVLTHRS